MSKSTERTVLAEKELREHFTERIGAFNKKKREKNIINHFRQSAGINNAQRRQIKKNRQKGK